MKRIKFLPIVFCMAMLAGCTSSPQSEEVAWEDMTLEERIETADTYSKITSCKDEYWLNKSSYSETERESLGKKLGEAELAYMISDGRMNGTFYYNEVFMSSVDAEKLGKKEGDKVSYTIVAYAISGDEIYIVPDEDAPDDIQDIPNMSNASEYKYKAEGDTTGRENCITINLVRNSDDYEIYVYYYEDSRAFVIFGNLPQQLDANGKKIWPSWQEYYSEQSASQEAAQSRYDDGIAHREEEQERDKELSKSTPKIGMTKNEVIKTSWGTPDKKNIDTYSWGTKEQWVYRSKGYVYFENGVVTSVSTSE